MKTRSLVLCGVFAAIMAVLSPIPFSIAAIPITLGFFVVFVCSGTLPPRLAVMTQIVYLLLGGVGMPVFSNFGGGLQKLVGPTGGFLLGYPIMALIISLLLDCYDNRIKKGKAFRVVWTAMTLLISAVAGHLCGCLWYSCRMGVGVYQAFMVVTLPFIVPEIIKIIAATVVVPILRSNIRPKARMN